MTLTNWAGTVAFTPGEVLAPRTIDEARALVAAAPRIRALGTGHSFNAIADSAALISMRAVDLPFELDEEARTTATASWPTPCAGSSGSARVANSPGCEPVTPTSRAASWRSARWASRPA
ncbi:MAG TPA: hypothetical protein PKY27_01345 [Arachnia sp.]|jgi:xylitol oxidase|nr:hypothetical protein [Propionibacteriaceae bacterium]HOA27965.1 hypothetical protein [Arachnia sp.]HQD20875.1 hypothetical protein [Arachnia sp.]